MQRVAPQQYDAPTAKVIHWRLPPSPALLVLLSYQIGGLRQLARAGWLFCFS